MFQLHYWMGAHNDVHGMKSIQLASHNDKANNGMFSCHVDVRFTMKYAQLDSFMPIDIGLS